MSRPLVRQGWPFAALGAIVLLALLAPVLPLGLPLHMDVAHRLAAPSAAHWLGQDEYGRDELSRLIWGARVSLLVAGASTALACAVGTLLGLAGGFLGRLAELLAVRSMDAVLCFPPLLLALLVVTLLGPGAGTLIPVLALVYLPGFVRVAYAGVLAVRGQDYVEAVRVLGAGRLRILARTVLPNIAGPLLVQISLAASSAVVLESGLSFLGLGVVPPAPSWGLMIAAGRTTMAQAPALLLWPCLALSLTILTLNAVCDTLRDATDPHRAMPRRRRLLDHMAPGLLPASGPVLEVRGLTVSIATPAGMIQPVRDVSLTVQAGETLAILGESGSGKSMLGLAVMGLLPLAARAECRRRVGRRHRDAARARSRAAPVARRADGDGVPGPAQQPQPGAPRRPPSRRRPWQAHGGSGRGASACRLLRRVGISDPARRARAYPHELSGGMRQRVVAAMAVANNPRLLIADEPTTALDVTIQAQVLDLLATLKREGGMGMVFISHSLPVVAEIADYVAVMYAGEIVEQGRGSRPVHPPAAPLHRRPAAQRPLRNGRPANWRRRRGASRSWRYPLAASSPPAAPYYRPICDAAHPPYAQSPQTAPRDAFAGRAGKRFSPSP